MKTYKLRDFVENPDNPSTVNDDEFAQVVRLVRENPKGLKADRIAYVTDHPAGKFVVLSGNKRLRALVAVHGADWDAPADYFQDVTKMSEDERNEFVVDANINDGRFDPDKLLKLYTREELTGYVGEGKIGDLIQLVETSDATNDSAAEGNGEASTVKLVYFKLLLPSKDFKRATEYLRRMSDDLAVAFMGVINGGRA